MSSTAVLMLAGLLVWGIAGIRVVASLVQRGPTPATLGDLAAWLLFLAGFLLHVWLESRRPVRGPRWAPLLLQGVCAILLARSAGGMGMEIALLVMVAGQLPGCVSMTTSLWWVVIQTGAILAAQVTSGSVPSWTGGILFFGSYSAFQLFAIGAASIAESEREAREALAAAKAELERMHGVALENARQAERLRIARDLHDSLGHRLTALGLTLEAALHVPAPDAPAKIAAARELASALMDDLRGAVGDIRDNETPELRSLLEGLARSVSRPHVSVDVAESLRITSPEATTALYRIGQEIVTNATRHSGATTLRLTLRVASGLIEFEGVDDGAASNAPTPGNGLNGIRERAELLGGDAEFGPATHGGFRVRVRIPLARLA